MRHEPDAGHVTTVRFAAAATRIGFDHEPVGAAVVVDAEPVVVEVPGAPDDPPGELHAEGSAKSATLQSVAAPRAIRRRIKSCGR
jgi:hypothetical protein